MPLIFQYGSNCDTERLNDPERLDGAAEDLGRAQTVGEYKIEFNKWSKKGKCAAADLVKPRKGGRRIWGVLYKVSRGGFKKLKDVEGPSYRARRIGVVDATGATMTATTFRVRRDKRELGRHTTVDYVRHIVKGLRAHDVEEVDPAYIQHVIDIALRTNEQAKDQDAGRMQNASIEGLRHP